MKICVIRCPRTGEHPLVYRGEAHVAPYYERRALFVKTEGDGLSFPKDPRTFDEPLLLVNGGDALDEDCLVRLIGERRAVEVLAALADGSEPQAALLFGNRTAVRAVTTTAEAIERVDALSASFAGGSPLIRRFGEGDAEALYLFVSASQALSVSADILEQLAQTAFSPASFS